jgi:RNA polymerase sigma-70 factor (ECF subfamily)
MKRNSEHILTEWLVINCQMGDAEALQQLLTMWYPKLLRYASRQLGDKQKAQDAVQNTLEVVSKTIRKVNDPAAFAKWVYQILHYKGVDIIRNKQKHDKLCSEYSQSLENAWQKNQLEPSNILVDTEFEQLLVGLAPDLYQLVHLHYLEGFSMSEIGELLDMPAGTVKSRLHQARNILRNNLSQHKNGEK